jgi:chromosome segregation ATPase
MTSDDLKAIVLALIVASPGLIALFGQLRKDNSLSKKTSSERDQLEDEITEKVLTRANQEIDKYISRITDLESQLTSAHQMIEQLQKTDKERTQAMSDIEEKFKRDALLRANIEETLKTAVARIRELETALAGLNKENISLKREMVKRDERIAELESSGRTLGGGLIKR